MQKGKFESQVLFVTPLLRSKTISISSSGTPTTTKSSNRRNKARSMFQLLFCSGDHRGTQPTAARRRHSLKEERRRRIIIKEPLHSFSHEMTLLRNVTLKSVGSVQAFKNESTRANRLDCCFFFFLLSSHDHPQGELASNSPLPRAPLKEESNMGGRGAMQLISDVFHFFFFKLARLHSSFVESTTPAVDKP